MVALSGVRRGVHCTDWLERLPLPETERAELARLRVRMATFGARLKEPHALPPFDALFPIGPSAYAFRSPTRLGGVSRQIHLEPGDPVPGAQMPVARFAFAGPGTVLLGWEAADGIRIARYPLPK